MYEFPKRQQIDTSTPQGAAMQKLQDCIYWHERERLGLARDMFLPECPCCPQSPGMVQASVVYTN